MEEAQAGIKIARRNINNLRYADDTTLMAESEEGKSLLMKVKEESKNVGLKLNIQKTKVMASGPITSWQIDGETVEAVSDFIFLEFPCFVYDPLNVGHLSSGSSSFSEPSFDIWKFFVHIMLKPSMQDFKHDLNSMGVRLGVDCGSDHELLIGKFRLKLKKVGIITRLFSYDLNQIPYEYTVGVRNRNKGLDLIDREPDELWTKVRDIVQETGIKTNPKEKKCKKAKWLSEKAL